MKITQLKESDPRIEKEFCNFFIKSTPYDLGHLRSPHLKRKKVERLLKFYLRTCLVYVAEEDSKIGVVAFLGEKPSYFDVNFIFGIRTNFTSSSLVAATRDIFDIALETHNKNYVKSEIRRKHKVETYKKWIERYDKRVIIFNDEKNSVVWCKSERMSVIFKVVAANKTTKHLVGKEAFLEYTRKGPRHVIRELLIENERYILDEKTVDFLPDRVLIHGLLSDDKENVGRIAFEFKPQK